MRHVRKLRRVRKKADPCGKKLVVFGVDPSLVGTATAIVSSGGNIEWAHGWTDKAALQKRHPGALSFWKMPQQDYTHRMARIDLMARWVLDHISEYRDTDNYEVYVAIEGLAVSQRSNRASDLAELSGYIKQGLWNMQVPFRIYDPTTLKMAWTGQGNADKAQMIMACYRRFRVDYTEYESAGENLADATLLAQLLYHEVEIRAGRKTMKELDGQLRKILLRTTKAEPEALASRPFVSSAGVCAKDPVYGCP